MATFFFMRNPDIYQQKFVISKLTPMSNVQYARYFNNSI